jgi:putative two-component system response regulator
LVCLHYTRQSTESQQQKRREVSTIINEAKAVARLAEIVALESGIHTIPAQRIRAAAELHDIGKKHIHPDILNKPGPLNEREFEIMKTHTVLGAEMLSGLTGEMGIVAKTVCRFHHENYDGSGYFGKYTDELPIYIPIISLSDVLVALLSARPYKKSWPPQEALEYIQSQLGTKFNPEQANLFLSLAQNDSRIAAIFMNMEEQDI